MPKQKPYLDQRVDDAIKMLNRQCASHPQESAECRYRIVVLTLLSRFDRFLRGLRTFLFFLGGLLGGTLLGKLLSLLLRSLIGG